ncbi:glutamyl-tRNA(Gln) amidotransferase subunit B, mitochondrial-like [Oppia nitens]|uniref:glutamyl-tRNA(Gln) amidotransferase subunit B, mitochondrial-like n=1 Tax=Oppia nitens TaxID=1686743 RepID=UPI0023DBF071|nr:glutamyl-tRNA(Gln) amidotransferase subunit B, mitochondrial-like [Oppia nitens]
MQSIVAISRLNGHKILNCRHLSSVTTMLSPQVISQYESVIGLEVHSQMTCKSKLFSSSGTSYMGFPNSQVSYFDCGLPGTLPVLNTKCVESIIKTGLALNCQISKKSTFDRKHYFYADMPSGYQITQQREPLAINGFIEFIVFNTKDKESYLKRSELKQIQLEQDSGKSLQDNNRALVDLNRAGIALMEFVFEPDLRNANEAVSLIRELILILKSLDTCSCKMEEGVLRVDANISVRKPHQSLGIRTEVKNLNSFRFIHSAIEYEINRQIAIIESGGQVVNETRMYDMKLKETVPMRDKEVVQDYRFMPEPNLPSILLTDDNELNNNLINISDIKRQINVKQMPNHLRNYLLNNYSLNLSQVYILMNESGMANTFTTIAKYIIDLLINESISSRIANQLLNQYFQNEKRSPNEVITQNNWTLITDDNIIKEKCLLTIETLPKIARKYANKGVRRHKSLLIENVMNLLDNRVNECDIWKHYDQLLRNNTNVFK